MKSRDRGSLGMSLSLGVNGLGKKKMKRNKQGLLKEKWDFDPNEPVYCYCVKPSFGTMVRCDNDECEV